MNIVIPGGTGHLGTLLTDTFRRRGDHVSVISRNVEAPAYLWDGKTLGAWAAAVDGADVVINLAGRSVNCRYDARRRAEILDSRVESTRVVGQAIAQAARPPRVWLQMSTATIYAHRFDAPNDEYSGIIGGHEPDVPDDWKFSIDVARAWENEVDAAQTPRTRKVKMRTAMVMTAARGGTFALLRRHVLMGFGRLGDGKQYMSWIHERDFLRAIEWLIADETMDGVVNIAAPEPLPNDAFIRLLREALGGHFGVPSSGWLLETGALLMRTEPELILKSRRVVPTRLLESGFMFDYPQWADAARDLAERFGESGQGPRW